MLTKIVSSIATFSIITAVFFIFIWAFSFLAPADVQGGTVIVNASVPTSVTCSNDVATTSLGTLSSGAIATSTPDASSTISCNTGTGCTLTIADAGNGANPGLSTTSPAYLIPSVTGTSTIVAGTEGYGINATSTTGGSGGTLNLGVRYTRKLSDSAIVGGLTLAGNTLASSSAQISNRQLLVRHGAAISATTQAGVYVDTLTYSCTAN